MNGARSTLMRKGYLFTALAAAVLLAASSGTAYAQLTATDDFGEGGVKVEVPETVAEGNSATITISASASVAVDSSDSDRTVSVEVTLPTAGTGDDTREDQDAQFNPGGNTTTVTLVFDANPAPTTGTGEAETSTVSKTVSLQTTHDPDAEDENVVLNVSASGGLNPSIEAKSTKIDDDETQTYVLTVTTEDPKEGSDIDVTLRADPEHDDGSVEMTLHLDDPKYTIADNTVTINTDTPQAGAGIMITPPSMDGNRVEDSVTLTAHSGAVGNSMQEASLTIDVADAHALPAVAAMVVDDMDKALDPQPESVMEGESIMVAVMPVDEDGEAMEAGEALEVELRATGSANALDYSFVGSFKIADGEMTSGGIELEVAMDEDVGMESLMFDAVVSGEMANGTETSTSAGVLSLYIEDNTTKKIEPKATEADYQGIKDAIAAGAGDEGLNPGETVTIMTSDLFDVMTGYTASYGVSVEGDSVRGSASGEMITIDAIMAGESKVTVTGTARMASSSLMPSQTVSNVAELTFPVMVVDKPVVVTLEMPANVMNGNIVEGESYDIMVSANRMVTEAEGSVEVTLMRDRSQSDADDSDFSVGSATIMAGYDSATAELMVTEDMMPDSGTNDNMGEQLVLYGMAGDMETNALTFTIWDQAVPTLPLIAQLLLALFLMAGGARLYRRRQG